MFNMPPRAMANIARFASPSALRIALATKEKNTTAVP